MKTIMITIKGRQMTQKTEGFSGAECQAATAKVSTRIGGIDSDDPTLEMFHDAAATENASAGN